MYPNQNNDTVAAFKKVLKEKSGLEVYCTFDNNNYAREANIANDYYIPDEPSRKHLKQGEFSYMDYAIPVQVHAASIKKIPSNLTELTNAFKKKVGEELNASIKAKREAYIEAAKVLEPLVAEWDAAQKKWEEEVAAIPEADRKPFELIEPKLTPDLHNFGKGGIINLLSHCDKKHGVGSAGAVFTKMILDSVEVANADECSTKEEYHRKFVMAFMKNPGKVKEAAKKNIDAGTWQKSFPRSANRFFDSVFAQMKSYMVASCKEMIKRAN
jgi:hypothetical protein